MIIHCENCQRYYDDEDRWTICPHNPLYRAVDEPYCRQHDLFNCVICASEGTDPKPTGEPKP